MMLRQHFGKLRWQLMLSYLSLIFVPVLVVAIFTRNATEQGLTLLVMRGSQRQAQLLSDCFARYYEMHGSWVGLSALLKPHPGFPPGEPGVPVHNVPEMPQIVNRLIL